MIEVGSLVDVEHFNTKVLDAYAVGEDDELEADTFSTSDVYFCMLGALFQLQLDHIGISVILHLRYHFMILQCAWDVWSV